ncbi:FAD-dependent oxidoreductase [Microvirga brassicacearum]|uniref:Rieske 2Fe-2S domain-containing protein n=1 Tax=Microvirga brassicacearum TaxID=2580413 RepID=A0A5N3P5L5_9HYPH|nr:FAD-dependent oxidoreductase [Microvirga brassicacearum]KAB0264993.1 Rieske 2Fe-2S domain-containing protein [Microvirga brassicacearum]
MGTPRLLPRTDVKNSTNPDFAKGVHFNELEDGGILAGHVGGEKVLLVRHGEEVFAIGASCTHYGAPLKDGLLVGVTIRCPWHHASFCLRTGEAIRAPALAPLTCWRINRRGNVLYVTEKIENAARGRAQPSSIALRSVVIVGGGAAGNAAAEMLRRKGYVGRLTMLSADDSAPCDRPNLSKGFLAGTASDASNALRSLEFYKEREIDLKLNARVAAIDPTANEVRLVDGTSFYYDALLLATGADPVRLEVPGSNLPHVHYLRTLTDGRALVAKALVARQAVVIGASFIGLEVTASLRARGIAVHIVAPDAIPMEKVLGPDIGTFVRSLHEDHGVTFHLETTVRTIDGEGVTLESGERLDADLIVVGIGVRPAITLAEQAGLRIDRGVLVDEYLQTSAPGIFAAGDIARWPDRLSNENIRVEHWVVAERQGQTAARNILGMREPFDCVPFFWTEQYDFSLGYIGHAEKWETAVIKGQIAERDCAITFRRGGVDCAVAVVHRDLEGLRAEVLFEEMMGISHPVAEPRERTSADPC